MLRSSRHIAQAVPWRNSSICCFCAARSQPVTQQRRTFGATGSLSKRSKGNKKKNHENLKNLKREDLQDDAPFKNDFLGKSGSEFLKLLIEDDAPIKDGADKDDKLATIRKFFSRSDKGEDARLSDEHLAGKSLKEALLELSADGAKPGKGKKKKRKSDKADLKVEEVSPEDFDFEPVDVNMPAVPMLAYGLDRVLFNPGVYRLQDPRTGVYNFDPYLEKIMPVDEFDFDALTEYKTSSKDEDLLAITRKLGVRYTGSTSSMSSVLQHFHFLLSAHRTLNHSMLSKNFPDSTNKFSRITAGPDAVFLRYKDGLYAIDADKTYDTPNVMSWLGHSLEKLLTTERTEFERYRRSNPEQTPSEGESARCFHYSKQGSILMRSQLDAQDPRLPGAGIFDLKTRAVVSIRMNHKEYQEGLGYQLRYAQGEWESFEREFYDMTRATMLKYSLQARMGRMDGIFIAYHNIERIFGFQYLSLSDMDQVLHGQIDTTLGDREFKLSIGLMEELLKRATEKFPETSVRLHFETRPCSEKQQPFMYVFAEPVTEERADEIQNTGVEYAREWARRVVGVGKNDPEAQEEWKDLQQEVDEQVSKDGTPDTGIEAPPAAQAVETSAESEVAIEGETTETGVIIESATEGNEPEEAKLVPPKHVKDESSSGPLAGWTLTVRNKVNGHYLKRPENLEPEDNWQIEYHIADIENENVWNLYTATKERRRQLVGKDEEEEDKGLANYRKIIQRYASRGRTWRTKQDQINEERGVQMFKPLGPGTPEYAARSDGEAKAEELAESRA
ncbi:hypothetical protein E8E12_006888 [Didymella heteroderae]|uniref:Pet127-domain-containing protein n=1 Tax=Didymella heteroderae TaxID=1769908 RepID=A0A9P4WLX8_9PLEO|nr:hypothetical protein E8E12_006888 [Didymella heteroderae]